MGGKRGAAFPPAAPMPKGGRRGGSGKRGRVSLLGRRRGDLLPVPRPGALPRRTVARATSSRAEPLSWPGSTNPVNGGKRDAKASIAVSSPSTISWVTRSTPGVSLPRLTGAVASSAISEYSSLSSLTSRHVQL